VVFKVDPSGKETDLHTFTGGAAGYSPYGNLLRDEAGDLYGTAVGGGDVSGSCSDVGGFLGCGTVYKTGPDRKIHRAAHLPWTGRGGTERVPGSG
jgi:hypothetical protein